MTAYEMLIIDWSSDVCSSDLPDEGSGRQPGAARGPRQSRDESNQDRPRDIRDAEEEKRRPDHDCEPHPGRQGATRPQSEATHRSEGGRVGKECVSTRSSRRSTYP